jgi:hypothetical protein
LAGLLFVLAAGINGMPGQHGHAFAADGDLWKTEYVACPRKNEISRRILPVPDSMLIEAVRLLESTSVVPLSMGEVAILLPGQLVEPNARLEAEIREAKKEAQKLEDMARRSPVDNAILDNKQWEAMARELRADIETLQRAFGRLKPYLVRGVVGFEGTGSFTGYVQGKELWIIHGSLGRGAPTLRRRPVVVLLEEQPATVHVWASVAE